MLEISPLPRTSRSTFPRLQAATYKPDTALEKRWRRLIAVKIVAAS
jgi:hypothetical protein